MPSTKRKTYTRDDGVIMVEIRPHEYVEESLVERLGLIQEGGRLPLRVQFAAEWAPLEFTSPW